MAVNIRRPRSGTHPMDAARIKSFRVRRSLCPRWGSHRENATGALGASQDDVSGFFAHEESDKARALRTKHGPLGCGGGDVAPRIAAALTTTTCRCYQPSNGLA